MELEVENIQVIELKMMDKRKYFPLTVLSGFTIRGVLYPFTLIKTRLQIQRGFTLYKGTFDAFLKIGRQEGLTGLYRGFWVNCLQIVPSLAYISTYEGTRHFMKEHTHFTNNKLRSFIAGGMASVVGQTLAVPFDIVSQHMMLLGKRGAASVDVNTRLIALQKVHISQFDKSSRFGAVKAIIAKIYFKEGFLGFYKGYFVSLSVFAPNSALWWFFYDSYANILVSTFPEWIPRLALQCFAAPLSGISSALMTNPLDVIRARIQVEGLSFRDTVAKLWKEEHVNFFLKGLSARLVQSVMFSFFIILGYETIKRWSLLDEYKNNVRW